MRLLRCSYAYKKYLKLEKSSNQDDVHCKQKIGTHFQLRIRNHEETLISLHCSAA